jgi:hypothetical protein
MRSLTIAARLAIIFPMALMLSPIISYSSSSPPNFTNSTSNGVELFTTDFSSYGLTYGEWTARWWQWAYSIPIDVHPAYDDSGKNCAEGQSGPVWFLAGTYEHPAERYCTIPAGKAILLPILNSECSYAEFPNLNTEEELRQCAKQIQDSVVHLEASIDGVHISGLEQSRLQSPLFNLTLGQNNILELPANTTTQAVSDGNWIFLKPLSVGEHVVYFNGGLKARNDTANNNSSNTIDPFAGPYGWDNPVTYHINIKEYNTDYCNKNNMDNNTNNEEVANEGSSKSKKGIQVSPTNESEEIVNDSNAVQEIPRPGVPDESKFKELKKKANETMKSTGEETVQGDCVAQEDN